MSHETHAARLIRRIAAKEIALFFASPIAYLFLGTFAAVTLFVFFWGEAFFSRNIADVRPMFEWMPILLVFLCSTLTMRLWSEERRSGTLEHVLTQPAPLWVFVAGKFAGCLLLLLAALLITLPLPLSVAILGELDWGPVWAGYLATFMLGAAYLSIGLFVSARSDNQIVSLISAVALCGVFYLIGTPVITGFFGTGTGEFLRLLGTGSRFEDITRGVIDLRDLYYYLSIVVTFLALNVFSLERERWSAAGDKNMHQGVRFVTALVLCNILGANLWLGQLGFLRADATEGNQYSLSGATRGYLQQLQEPLLLRGYFSAKTHPLLAPLVPQLQDLMQEYAIAGGGRVQVEFIDPVANPELEDEANRQYGIQPVPFQVADRYQSSIVSSYFNVLVKYGDEYKVLGFDDLIEIRNDHAATDIEVELRNPEHDLTRSIRTVLNDYQASGNLFDTIQDTVTLSAYISSNAKLPEQLQEFRDIVRTVAEDYASRSGGELRLEFVDPEAGDGAVARRIEADYGFRPMATSLFSDDRFYFYLVLGNEEQLVQIPFDDMTESAFERNLKAGLQRFSAGFTRTVAVVAPGAAASPMAPPMPAHNASFSQLRNFLGSEYTLVDEDLGDGRVSGQADLLLLLAPENLDEKALFAVDQFLMQGGTVIAATSPYKAQLTGNQLTARRIDSGLEDWLAHHGLSIGETLVMDTRNAAFPIPVTRNVGGFALREWRMLDYPYFVDVRQDGLNAEHMITAELPQLTMAWASPITVDAELNRGREITTLLRSSEQAWLSDDTNVMPTIDEAGNSDYSPGEETGSRVLGLISSGSFDSYFADKESPLLAEAETEAAQDTAADTASEAGQDEDAQEESAPVISGVIAKSPESARIILFSSNDFLEDQVVQLLGTAGDTEYLNSLQLLANNIDWSLEDPALLSIRSRGHFNRTLPPMEREEQMLWEYMNYGSALLAVGFIAALHRGYRFRKIDAYKRLLGTSSEGRTHT